MPITFSVLIFLLSVIVLIYWIKTMIVMSDEWVFLVLGLVVSPLAQIGYFVSRRKQLDKEQVVVFKRYFWFVGVFFAVCLALMTLLNVQLNRANKDTMNDATEQAVIEIIQEQSAK